VISIIDRDTERDEAAEYGSLNGSDVAWGFAGIRSEDCETVCGGADGSVELPVELPLAVALPPPPALFPEVPFPALPLFVVLPVFPLFVEPPVFPEEAPPPLFPDVGEGLAFEDCAPAEQKRRFSRTNSSSHLMDMAK